MLISRSATVFEQIYYNLLAHYKPSLSDSRFRESFGKELSIIDSTTIFLFKDILKCVGRKPVNGKNKGGIKVHLQIRADYNLPTLVKFLQMLLCMTATLFNTFHLTKIPSIASIKDM